MGSAAITPSENVLIAERVVMAYNSLIQVPGEGVTKYACVGLIKDLH